MDSGIDSTESSNGSVEELGAIIHAAPIEDPQDAAPGSQPSSSISLAAVRPNTPAPCSIINFYPASLKDLAASTVSEIETEVLENNKNQAEPLQVGSQDLNTPPNTPAHTTFKLVSD